MIIREIRAEDNATLAKLIRSCLEKHELNIPGTAYFDESLDRLSDYYNEKPAERKYFVGCDDEGRVIGGVGYAQFDGFDSCVELQKLYLDEDYQGQGLGRALLSHVISAAKGNGYGSVYLETHSNLKKAIGLYIKEGFDEIEKPDCVVHSTMDLFYKKSI